MNTSAVQVARAAPRYTAEPAAQGLHIPIFHVPHTIAPCGAWELDSSGRTSTAAPATTC